MSGLDRRLFACYTLAAPSTMNRHPFSAKGRSAVWAVLRLLLVPVVITLAACYPKYKTYESDHGDFRVEVPYEWLVMTDAEGTHFTNTTFIGPFEPDFFLGAPTLSVRWHAYFEPHTLPDNAPGHYSTETYSDVEDYMREMVAEIYGKEAILRSGTPLRIIKDPREMGTVRVAGLTARHIEVLAPVEVPKDYTWGVSEGRTTKKLVVLRKHAYVLLPLEDGFYVFIYPATSAGYKKYEGQFFNMVNSFAMLKKGPGGKPLKK